MAFKGFLNKMGLVEDEVSVAKAKQPTAPPIARPIESQPVYSTWNPKVVTTQVDSEIQDMLNKSLQENKLSGFDYLKFISAVEETRATVLKSTKEASHIIADVFFVKKAYLEANREKVRNLVEGWMIGNAQINSDATARSQAAQILVDGLNVDKALADTMIGNARLTTLGDNQNFFGLTHGFNGMTAEKLYTNMTQEYSKVNMAPAGTPNYRTVFNGSIIAALSLQGSENLAEPGERFTPATVAEVSAPAFSTKKLSITFPTGSSTLDDNSKAIINMGFVDIAKGFSNSRIRVEGNTDNVGSESVNRVLSQKRAQSVANYLIQEQGFDANRIVVVGNGSSKPAVEGDQNSPSVRAKNRRTDFELLGK